MIPTRTRSKRTRASLLPSHPSCQGLPRQAQAPSITHKDPSKTNMVKCVGKGLILEVERSRI